jgi:hypothetical protein
MCASLIIRNQVIEENASFNLLPSQDVQRVNSYLEVTVTSSSQLSHFHLEVTFFLEFLVGSEFMSNHEQERNEKEVSF